MTALVRSELAQVAIAFGATGVEATSVSASDPLPVIATGPTGASANQVQGTTASNAPIGTAKPIGVTGEYNAPMPTFDAGDVAALQLGVRGRLMTGHGLSFSGQDAFSNASMLWMAADTNDNVSQNVLVTSGLVFNGTSHDRPRNNVDTAALISAVGATIPQAGADQTNYNGRGLQVVLDMTAAGTGSVTLTIQGKDAASGKYYTLLSGAAVTTNSTNVYTVYPGATAAANVAASTILPRTWRVTTAANNANATTYTVGASVIL